ncbi:MAG TPA: hypothetical protein VKL22_06710 [Actinomycetota bacterium]|nr:hypothetical protein [Actinomycetota bacterium]
MVFAVGAVAAALVAAVSVCVFQVLRTIGTLRGLKTGLDQFRGEAEPLAREVVALAEEAATRAQGLSAAMGAKGTKGTKG